MYKIKHQWWCQGKEPCACLDSWKEWQERKRLGWLSVEYGFLTLLNLYSLPLFLESVWLGILPLVGIIYCGIGFVAVFTEYRKKKLEYEHPNVNES